MAGEGGIGGTPEHPGTNRDSSDGESVVPGSTVSVELRRGRRRGPTTTVGFRAPPQLLRQLDAAGARYGLARAALLNRLVRAGLTVLCPEGDDESAEDAGAPLSSGELAAFIRGGHELDTVRTADPDLLPLALRLDRELPGGLPGTHRAVDDWIMAHLSGRLQTTRGLVSELYRLGLLPSQEGYGDRVYLLSVELDRLRDRRDDADVLAEAVEVGWSPRDLAARGAPQHVKLMDKRRGRG
jgi:hypothetical protein